MVTNLRATTVMRANTSVNTSQRREDEAQAKPRRGAVPRKVVQNSQAQALTLSVIACQLWFRIVMPLRIFGLTQMY